MKYSLFLIIFGAAVFSLSAVDMDKSSAALTSGITVDVAPFGIEQVYFTVKGFYSFKGPVKVSFMPSFSVNHSSVMLRVPLVIEFSGYLGSSRNSILSGYVGGGVEAYTIASHTVYSPLVTYGILLRLGVLCIDIPIVSAFRYYNTDSDIGITAGFSFPVL